MKKLILLMMAVTIWADAAPIRKVDAGIVQFKQSDQVTPSPPANYSNIFVKSDGKAYVSGSAGLSSMEQLHSGAENLSGSLFTGTLPISKGGTGQSTQTSAFDALSPNTTAGDITYYNGSDNVRLGLGTSGYVLTVSGSAPAWVSPSSSSSSTIRDYFHITGPNGTGSTDDKIRLFTTTTTNVGTAFTISHGATTGTTVTLNSSGIYVFCRVDQRGASSGFFGISVNSSQRTTSITSITAADRLIHNVYLGGGGDTAVCTAPEYLQTNDVIRPHDSAVFDNGSGTATYFKGTKIGN